MSNQKKKGLTLAKKHNLTGWAFLLPATLLIGWMSFYPMIRAFILSLQTGMGVNLSFNGFANYARILKDPTFKQTLFNILIPDRSGADHAGAGADVCIYAEQQGSEV